VTRPIAMVVLVGFVAALLAQGVLIGRQAWTATSVSKSNRQSFLRAVDRHLPRHASYAMPRFVLYDRAVYALYPRGYVAVDFADGEAVARRQLRAANVHWILIAPPSAAPPYLRVGRASWYRVTFRDLLGEVVQVMP
jgi:hypothetical protein